MKFSKEIPNFMKHHLMVFAPDTDVKINNVYVIARNACKWNLMNVCNRLTKLSKSKAINTTKKNPMMFTKTISLTGNVNELLYFVKLVGKRVATDYLKDTCWHVIRTGELYFTGNYLKIIRPRSINHKEFKLIPTTVVFEPDEVYDTYVNINQNLRININFVTLFYWKLTIEFVSKSCKYFYTVLSKCCILALVNIFLFLFCFAERHGINSSCFALFYQNFWDERACRKNGER